MRKPPQPTDLIDVVTLKGTLDAKSTHCSSAAALVKTLSAWEIDLIKKVTIIVKQAEDGVASDAGALGISGSIKNRDLFIVTKSLFFRRC